MLISKVLEEAINKQIGDEFEASLIYLSVATYFDSESLPQLASFFYRQSEEEKTHALKFVHYIVEAGGQVRIPAIDAIKYDFASAEDCAQLALDWELEVTRKINNLMDIAVEEKDYIGQDFLRWFVTEQLEEVSNMDTLLNVLRRAGDNLLLVEEYMVRNPIVSDSGGTEEA